MPASPASARSRAAAPDDPGRVEERRRSIGRVELEVGVGRARDAQQLVAAAASLGIEKALGAIEAAARHAGECTRLGLGETRRALGQERAHRTLRQPPERDELAAREDRRRDRAELVRDEHDHRVRRRLLEVLQQRVGGVLVQQVRVGDHVDTPVGLVRPHVQIAMERAHLVDPDHLPQRLEQEEVGVRAGRDAALVTEELSRERQAAARLPTPAGPWRR